MIGLVCNRKLKPPQGSRKSFDNWQRTSRTAWKNTRVIHENKVIVLVTKLYNDLYEALDILEEKTLCRIKISQYKGSKSMKNGEAAGINGLTMELLKYEDTCNQAVTWIIYLSIPY